MIFEIELRPFIKAFKGLSSQMLAALLCLD
jgi:hypothetical protein